MFNILSLSKASDMSAKQWLYARRVLDWTTLGLACGAIIFAYIAPSSYRKIIELLIALGAMLAQIASTFCHYTGKNLFLLSRESRRRALLMNSFGAAFEAEELRHLSSHFNERLRKKAVAFGKDDKFYSSTKPEGVMRLCDNLQESVFFSSVLYKQAAQRCLILFVIPSLVVVSACFLLPLLTTPQAFSVSRALTVMMAFLCTSGGIWESISFFSASKKSNEIDRRLDSKNSLLSEAAFAIFADYCVVTASTPPIPSKLYLKHREVINQDWDRYINGQSAAP